LRGSNTKHKLDSALSNGSYLCFCCQNRYLIQLSPGSALAAEKGGRRQSSLSSSWFPFPSPQKKNIHNKVVSVWGKKKRLIATASARGSVWFLFESRLQPSERRAQDGARCAFGAFLMLFGLCPFLAFWLSQDPPAVRITFNPEPVPREGFPNWDEERREKKGRPLRGLHVI